MQSGNQFIIQGAGGKKNFAGGRSPSRVQHSTEQTDVSGSQKGDGASRWLIKSESSSRPGRKVLFSEFGSYLVGRCRGSRSQLQGHPQGHLNTLLTTLPHLLPRDAVLEWICYLPPTAPQPSQLPALQSPPLTSTNPHLHPAEAPSDPGFFLIHLCCSPFSMAEEI